MKNISKVLISAIILTNIAFSATVAQPAQKQVGKNSYVTVLRGGNQGGVAGPGDTDGWD